MKRKAHFQRTLAAQSSFEKYDRKSKWEQFLDEMNKVVPWASLLRSLSRITRRQATAAVR
jgi:hypothetical protein